MQSRLASGVEGSHARRRGIELKLNRQLVGVVWVGEQSDLLLLHVHCVAYGLCLQQALVCRDTDLTRVWLRALQVSFPSTKLSLLQTPLA